MAWTFINFLAYSENTELVHCLNHSKNQAAVSDRVIHRLIIFPISFTDSMIPLVGDSILEREDADDDDDVE